MKYIKISDTAGYSVNENRSGPSLIKITFEFSAFIPWVERLFLAAKSVKILEKVWKWFVKYFPIYVQVDLLHQVLLSAFDVWIEIFKIFKSFLVCGKRIWKVDLKIFPFFMHETPKGEFNLGLFFFIILDIKYFVCICDILIVSSHFRCLLKRIK